MDDDDRFARGRAVVELGPPDHREANEPVDDGSVDILYLVDQLEALVSIGKRVPFSGRVMVEEDQFLRIVDQLRVAVPDEIKQAQRVIREREEIVAESHDDAARILEAARQRAEYAVSEQGILQEARLKGEELLQSVQQRRGRVIGEIDAFVLEQLDIVERAMSEGLAMIDRTIEDTVAILREARENVGR